MHRKWLFYSSILIALSIVFLLAFYFFQKNKEEKLKSLTFNPVSGNWEAAKNPQRIELNEADPSQNEDGLNNRSIIRGYFDQINQDKNEITIKMALPFTGESQYKLATFKLTPDQKTFCSPSTIEDQITGKTHETKSLGFIVKNGQTMNISREQIIPFDQFYENANEKTYVFLQLTKDYSEKESNYIQKIVVVGICD